jgi:hypothetical protein
MQHIQHRVPGAAQSEATVSIKIPGVKPDLDGFLYDPIHESSHLIQDGNTVEIDVMTRVETMLCHS